MIDLYWLPNSHLLSCYVKELNVLMMNNGKYSAEIAKAVSSKKRKQLVERAQQLAIKVTNPFARIRTEENE